MGLGSKGFWLLFLVGSIVVVSALFRRSGSRPGNGGDVRATATPSHGDKAVLAVWPLAPGNRWTYREKKLDVGRGQVTENTVSWSVVGETRLGWRLSEDSNGRSVNTFTLVSDDQGIHLYEYESQARPLLLLPLELKPGDQWNLNEVQRAKVVREVEKEVLGRSIPSFEIRFERFYGKDWTDEPGWFEDGTFWVSPGTGIVAKDLSRALRPPLRDRKLPKETWGAIGAVWTLVDVTLK